MPLLFCALALMQQSALSGDAAEVFSRAKTGRHYETAAKLNPDILPTSDGKSFYAVWRSGSSKTPKKWIVSIHGSGGYATDDLALWSKHLKGRDVGLVCLQWWIGLDNTNASYLNPEKVYAEIDFALGKLGVKPGTVMFHGFSRGSANSYAIAAMDAGKGKKYFALNVASSGGYAVDFPANRKIMEGGFGDHPLKGTHWVTSAGAKDQPRDGIEAMRRSAEWLKEQGATVEFSIEDPNSGHGALMTNPENAKRLLDFFLGKA